MDDLVEHELFDSDDNLVAIGYELFGDGVIQKVGILDDSGEVSELISWEEWEERSSKNVEVEDWTVYTASETEETTLGNGEVLVIVHLHDGDENTQAMVGYDIGKKGYLSHVGLVNDLGEVDTLVPVGDLYKESAPISAPPPCHVCKHLHFETDTCGICGHGPEKAPTCIPVLNIEKKGTSAKPSVLDSRPQYKERLYSVVQPGMKIRTYEPPDSPSLPLKTRRGSFLSKTDDLTRTTTKKLIPVPKFVKSNEDRNFATVFESEARVRDVDAVRGDKLVRRGSIAELKRRESQGGQRHIARPTPPTNQKIYDALTRLSELQVSKKDVLTRHKGVTRRVRAISSQFGREHANFDFAHVESPHRRVSLNHAAIPLNRLDLGKLPRRQRFESYQSHGEDRSYRYPMSTEVFESLTKLVSICEYESDTRPSIPPKSSRRKRLSSFHKERRVSFRVPIHVEPAQRRHSAVNALEVDRHERFERKSLNSRVSKHERQFATQASPIRGYDERIRWRGQASINFSSAFDTVLRRHRNKERRAEMDLPSYPNILALDQRLPRAGSSNSKNGFVPSNNLRRFQRKITTIMKRTVVNFPLRSGLFRKVRDANDAWFSAR